MEIFTPLHPAMLADPYPVYARLREQDPVHRHDQLDAYVLTRHRDCDRVLQDPQAFVSDFRAIGDDVPESFLSLQSLDPPAHGAVRRIVLAALRATDLSDWLADVGTSADKLLGSLGEGELDFVTEFAEPLAASSMCALFGVPLLQDEDAFRTAQRELVLSMDSGLAPERGPVGMRARAYLSELIQPWVVEPPPVGLLGRVDFAAAGESLPYLVNSLRAVFVAGYSSSSSMLGTAVRVLVERGLLAADESPVITPLMLHELVRYVGPVQAESRAVAADVELGGRRLHRGDIVVTVLGAANRDPEVFEAPEELHFERNPNPHLGFGKGIHSCIGARLALRLLADVLGALARTYRIELAGDPVQRPTATLRGLDRLPLRLQSR